ncbi:MAG: hypothetical protein ACRD0U_05060 [Acidimicrobiales bacterium]
MCRWWGRARLGLRPPHRSHERRVRIPEVDLGVPLFWTGVPRLVRELGPAPTKELVLTGRSVDAAEARSIRFVNRVVADAALEAETRRAGGRAGVQAHARPRGDQATGGGGDAAGSASDGGVTADVAAFAAALTDTESRAAASAYWRRLRKAR